MKGLKLLCLALGIGIAVMIAAIIAGLALKKGDGAPVSATAAAPAAPAGVLAALPAGARLVALSPQPDYVLATVALPDGRTQLITFDPFGRRAPVAVTLPGSLPGAEPLPAR